MKVWVILWSAGDGNPWSVVGVATSQEIALRLIDDAQKRESHNAGHYMSQVWHVDQPV